jgi:hypothetical protein
MAEYEKKVRDILQQNGCHFERRGKGDHDIWYSTITNSHVTVCPQEWGSKLWCNFAEVRRNITPYFC